MQKVTRAESKVDFVHFLVEFLGELMKFMSLPALEISTLLGIFHLFLRLSAHYYIEKVRRF